MKKAQVTIFIILAILIVGSVIAYFVLRDDFMGTSIPEDLKPVYDYYVSCLEDRASEGIALLGEQGGRIDSGAFEPGSAYMPFSSHLDFMGQAVPYWMHVSGNNLLKESVPTKGEMERELAGYVSERVGLCDFSDFEAAGFDVFVDGGDASSKINELDVEVVVDNKISIFKGNSSVVVSSHELDVSSKLGKFYSLAVDVYDYEKANMFLENYALDVLRLYAPVDGIEFGCAPKIFVEEEIVEDLKDGLAANIASIRLDGDYYDLSSDEREYFVEDSGLNLKENVNFMYLQDWTTRVEMYGDKVVKPVGLQEGLGVLGFCYVPYHFVYDVNFPVMVQFFDDNELFQFPVGVVISRSQPREALPTTNGFSIESRVCEMKNQEVDVYTYDVDLNPVEAVISFKCLDAVCNIGETEITGEDAILNGEFPQCVNGFVVADAEGYAQAKYQISTNEESLANVVLKKKYNLSLDLGNVDKAVVNFISEDFSATVLYPEMDSLELVEGYYNVSVYVYDGSSLKFPATSRSECVDVPESGLMGLFGAETEKCYDINMPEMDIDFAVVGGGKTREYITSEDLDNADEINLNVPLFGLPASLEELSANHERVDDEIVEVYFE
ncbi:hypothetical protein HN903_04930 [archaeon]|jgi:hypothetical protein|nr:hypothetical protein [archaeon]MBT7129072.1 hypothetical protein [archaeon]